MAECPFPQGFLVQLDNQRTVIVQSGTSVGIAAWESRGLVLCSIYRQDAGQQGFFLMSVDELLKAIVHKAAEDNGL